MSAEWTPPAEAVEAAAWAMYERRRSAYANGSLGGYEDRDEFAANAAAALIGARPVLVAEALAELERWQGATFEREAAKNAAESRARIAEQKLAAVAAMADEIESSGRRLGYSVAHELRVALGEFGDRT